MKNPFKNFGKVGPKEVAKAISAAALVIPAVPAAADNPPVVVNINNNDKNFSETNSPSVVSFDPNYIPKKQEQDQDEPEEEENDTEGGSSPEFDFGGPVVLNISASFKTATVEFINKEAEVQAKNAIKQFLEGVNLKNTKIKAVGTFSTRRDWDKNNDIAEERRNVGLKILKQVLSELGYAEGDVTIESEARGQDILELYTQEQLNNMTQAEIEKAIDQTQGIHFELITMEDPVPRQQPRIPEKNFNNPKDYANVGYLLIDPSPSMQNDNADVQAQVGIANKSKSEVSKTEVVTLIMESGNKEAHFKTLNGLLSRIGSYDTPVELLVITDEPDETLGGDYESFVSNIIALAKEKNVKIFFKVFNPYKPAGGFKVFELNETNKHFMKPASGTMTDQLLLDKWYKAIK